VFEDIVRKMRAANEPAENLNKETKKKKSFF